MQKNWAGNIEYGTDRLWFPKSVGEVQELVRKYSKLKVLGSRHCFNRIADSGDNLISLQAINQVISLNEKTATVTIGGGMIYGQLCPFLNNHGFALHNLASLPHISVAGACATATHGSGIKNGNLATAIAAFIFVTADGNLLELSREKNPDIFPGAVVNIGGLGVITSITLDLQAAYEMRQDVYEHLSFEQLEKHIDEILGSAYSISFFTNWVGPDIAAVWIKRKIEKAVASSAHNEFFGAIAAAKDIHPDPSNSAENCTPQMGIPGPWFERLPHFRMGFMPSVGDELQSEYFVPIDHAMEAIDAVRSLGNQISLHLIISEIRTVAADDLWMSPCYHRTSVAIHFTWKPHGQAVSAILPLIEKALAPFAARPHWGKVFTMSTRELETVYEKLPDFRNLLLEYDPAGKFRNDFLDDVLTPVG